MKQRVFIVTGANSGIGFATVKALAGAGATAILCARTQQKADEAAAKARAELAAESKRGGEVIPMQLDLANTKSIFAFVDAFKAKNLPLHGLVENGACTPSFLSNSHVLLSACSCVHQRS